MRKAVATVLCGAFATNVVALTPNDAVQVVAGLVSGVIGTNVETQITTCIQNAPTLVTEVETAVADFQKGSFDGILSGFEEIATIIQQIPSDLSTCEAIEADLPKILAFAAQFADVPTLIEHLTENLLTHFSEIKGDVQTALTDFSQADYFDFGDEIGTALETAVE